VAENVAKKHLTIALAGNPNAGKTTIFNAITGAHQHVGNWPGVTVEKKEGRATFGEYDLTIVDLPGTYSLTAYSIEEIVARRYVVHERPDVVVQIIDAGNLERNLLLTTQLIELECKLVLALNVFDAVEESGAKIDIEMLGTLLGAPAVATVGTRESGIQELMETVIRVAEDEHPKLRPIEVRYGTEIDDHLDELQGLLKGVQLFDTPHPVRWTAIKLLEQDEEILRVIREKNGASEELLHKVEKVRHHLTSLYRDDPESVITERRYGFVAGVLKEVYSEPTLDRISMSDQIDSVLTHKFVGLPVFFLAIWGMFQATFTIGAIPADGLEAFVAWLASTVNGMIAPGLLRDLIVEGAINGVGAVLVFLPNIFILFFCISFFEDTGYMARAAFLTDRVMHMLGLHGKAFIPMLMGFGCNVPAIMATRTLESHRDRVLTILINPLISCSARLPVYILLAGAFFTEKYAGTAIFSIYLLGMVLAIAMGKLFSKTILPGESAPFVMELPPYRLPTLKSSMLHTWERGKIFIRKMGGLILVGSVLIWFLGAFPQQVEFSKDYDTTIAGLQSAVAPPTDQMAVEDVDKINSRIAELEIAKETERLEKSYIGRIGKVIEPVLAPLGFDWRGGVALATGFVAKEIVVSTLGVLYQTGTESTEEDDGLREALAASNMTPLSAYAFMAFVLIYTPCLGTIAAIRRETNSWKWTAFSVSYSLALAWVVAALIVYGGRVLGLG
jgi:ferrous iron transport protein B